MFTIAIGICGKYPNDLSIFIVNVGREMFGIGQYKMTRRMSNGVKIVFEKVSKSNLSNWMHHY